MSGTGMYDALAALKTAIESTTGSLAPQEVNLVPQNRGDARVNQGLDRWVNLAPAGEPEYIDEPGGSFIAAYAIEVSAWIVLRSATLAAAVQQVASYWRPILLSFLHSKLGSYGARVGIRGEDVEDVKYEAGDDKDQRYLVRCTVTIHRQESMT